MSVADGVLNPLSKAFGKPFCQSVWRSLCSPRLMGHFEDRVNKNIWCLILYLHWEFWTSRTLICVFSHVRLTEARDIIAVRIRVHDSCSSLSLLVVKLQNKPGHSDSLGKKRRQSVRTCFCDSTVGGQKSTVQNIVNVRISSWYYISVSQNNAEELFQCATTAVTGSKYSKWGVWSKKARDIIDCLILFNHDKEVDL